MKKFKLDKKNSVRLIAGVMTLTMSFPIIGCGKKETKSSDKNSELYGPFISEIVTDDPSDVTSEYDVYKSIVENNVTELKNAFPMVSDDIINDASLIILLDVLAKEDENNKINPDVISNFKSRIDSDNMMDNFNSFIDSLENEAIVKGNNIYISSTLPDDMDYEKKILSSIEGIAYNIKLLSSDSNNKDKIKDEFKKIYTLFVEEDEIEENGLKFKVRDLPFSLRSVANADARIAAFYAKYYITDEEYKAIDNRTNDQNNKAYIKTKLEILRNSIDEISKEDIKKILNNKYTQIKNLLQNKVNTTDEVINSLVNFVNIEYITSDKVATKDRNEILSTYNDDTINDVMILIDAIIKYNLQSQNGYIAFSDLLIEPYLETDKGNMSYYALNRIELDSILLTNYINENTKFTDIYNVSYFDSINKYLTKQDFTHKYKDEAGTIVSKDIYYQSIGLGAVFVNDEILRYTFSNVNIKGMESFKDKSNENMGESIQDMGITITEECEKQDVLEFVK